MGIVGSVVAAYLIITVVIPALALLFEAFAKEIVTLLIGLSGLWLVIDYLHP